MQQVTRGEEGDCVVSGSGAGKNSAVGRDRQEEKAGEVFIIKHQGVVVEEDVGRRSR